MWITDFFKKKKLNMAYARMLNGQTPIFSQFGQDIYASDVVQQAINCIVREMKKITPVHERQLEGIEDYVTVAGSVQKILNNPNQLMTSSDFIEKIVWQLFFNYNSFILPTWDRNNNLVGMFPISPTQVDFLEDPNGKLAIQFRFANNYETTLYYEDVIHIRYNYSVNEFMGGDDRGQPDHKGILKTLQINEDLLQGIAKGVKASYSANGVVKYNTMMDDGTMEENLREFERKLNTGDSGILGMDVKSEYIKLTRDVKLVDTETLKFIDNKILRHFGVSLPILTGDYTKKQYEAFYQKTLEPLIIALSQAFTKGIFRDRERSYGNRISFSYKNSEFMTMEQKLELVRVLGDCGAMYENEKRALFGYRPIQELAGQRKQSLNYVNSNIADQYQLQNNNEKSGDEE